MKALVKFLFRKFLLQIALRVRYKQNPRLYYYDSMTGQETLHKSKNTINAISNIALVTKVPITFRNINLFSDVYSIIKELGIPRFQIKTKYGSHKHHVFVYKMDFCDLNTKVVINVLNNTILECAYHIEPKNAVEIEKIKSVIEQKYGIGKADGYQFTITDKAQNKISFNYQFDLVISYINGSDQAHSLISDAFHEVASIKAAKQRAYMKKLEVAF